MKKTLVLPITILLAVILVITTLESSINKSKQVTSNGKALVSFRLNANLPLA